MCALASVLDRAYGRVHLEQRQRLHLDPLRDPLDGPEREVPLAALEPAHVGAVHADELRAFIVKRAGEVSAR